MVWWIAAAVAGLILLAYVRTRNAIWGAATMGFIIGLIVAAIKPGFDWSTVGKAVVIGTYVGFGTEMLFKLTNKKGTTT